MLIVYGYIIAVVVVFLAIIIGRPRPCKVHAWPKQKTREKIWNEKEKKWVESSTRWIGTKRDEWLPVTYGAGFFRVCRKCHATEIARPREYDWPINRCLEEGIRFIDESTVR